MYFSLSGLLIRKLNRLTRSCSLAAVPVRAPILLPHVLTERPRSGFQVMLSTPPQIPRWLPGCPNQGAIQFNSYKPGRLAHYWHSPGVPKSGQTSPYPAAQPAGGVVILEPFRERPAGPKHTRAEQDEN